MAINRNYRSKNSSKGNAGIRDTASEAARIQKVNRYRSQISQLNGKIDGFNTDIAKLRREIERLREFEADRKTAWGNFQSDYADRQKRLTRVQDFTERCLMAKRYFAGMSEDLNGGRMVNAISSVEATFSIITSEIQKREDRIQELQSQINSLEGQVASLFQMIANA